MVVRTVEKLVSHSSANRQKPRRKWLESKQSEKLDETEKGISHQTIESKCPNRETLQNEARKGEEEFSPAKTMDSEQEILGSEHKL
jgi:hypothetical protein